MTNSNKHVLIGKREVIRACKANKLEKIMLALDVDENYKKEIISIAKQQNILIFQENTAEEVAKTYGIDVKCGVVGILKDIEG